MGYINYVCMKLYLLMIYVHVVIVYTCDVMIKVYMCYSLDLLHYITLVKVVMLIQFKYY